ncbi:MAG: FAD-dependent monooxygenase [Hyphomicrobiaceae bacterium]
MHDCLIIGAGPVALATARALNLRGLTFCLCGELPRQRPNSPDLRTAALFEGSIRLLERLDAWSLVQPAAARLAAIRIIDATGRLLRAPEQLFSGIDMGAAELGFNIPNPALVDALRATLAATEDVTRTETDEINLTAQVTHIEICDDHITATLADHTRRHGRMAIAADGRNSMTRNAAGIGIKTWDHNQAAITAHFEHDLPNDAISTELHSRAGPCTVVPLGPNKSSLVWMEHPDTAHQLAALPDEKFIAALEERLEGLLGPVRHVTTRRVFPLSSLIADRFAARRVALVGESGHAFPPIGAQGLNLGLRDAASLVDHLADARQSGHDIGADRILDAYSASRRSDIVARTYGVDAFNVSLADRAAGLLRGAALHATHASPAFKRFLLARGMQPVGPWPTMMRQ